MAQGPRDVGRTFVDPGVLTNVVEKDVVFPGIGTAGPQPKVAAVIRNARPVARKRCQTSRCRPYVKGGTGELDEALCLRAWDTNVEVSVRASGSGERINGPAASDPPPSRVTAEPSRVSCTLGVL